MIHKLIHLNKYYPLDGDPTLECYVMDNKPQYSQNRSSILILPGGGYEHLSKAEADPIAFAYLSANYNAFVLRYTVKKAYPAPMKEVMCAFDYIISHKRMFQVNENKMVLCGFSAGGHLASSYSYLVNNKELSEGLNLKHSPKKPDALVLSYPVITMKDGCHKVSRDFITGNDENLRDLLSVEKNISKDYPPTFVWTILGDTSVPVEYNTRALEKALKEKHIKHIAYYFEGLHHGIALANEITTDITPENKKGMSKAHTWVNKSQKFIARVFSK